ncbi:MAG: hypothetical protein ACMUEK_02050 [Sodalis sp. (in: enterobacteria)]
MSWTTKKEDGLFQYVRTVGLVPTQLVNLFAVDFAGDMVTF